MTVCLLNTSIKKSLQERVFEGPCGSRIFSFLSNGKERAALARVSKSFSSLVDVNSDTYPLHHATSVEAAQKHFSQMKRDKAVLFRREKLANRSPAMFAFRQGCFDVAEFYVAQGGEFEAHNNFHIIKHALYFEFPAISQAIRDSKWKFAKDKAAALQAILIETCNKGSHESLQWVINKQKEASLPLTALSVFEPLQEAVKGGFDQIVTELGAWHDFSSLSEDKKRVVIALSLEMGYPQIMYILERHHFPISKEQRKEAEEQIKVGDELCHLMQPKKEDCKTDQKDHTVKKSATVPIFSLAPQAVNKTHNSIHGGKANEAIYQAEFQKATAYAVFYLRKKNCSVRQLIENLGHRRRRMAVLGKLAPLDSFGKPQLADLPQSTTPYGKSYSAYGAMVRKKYEGSLPIQVTFPIQGLSIPLTEIGDSGWIHPDGSNRDILLDKVDFEARQLLPTAVLDTPGLAAQIGRIYWLLSHAAPFCRGTPTITAILVDALWIHQKRLPPPKTEDLNCLSLTYDNCRNFMHYMYKRQDLPKALIK